MTKLTTVSRWGNSLGLRLPKEAAKALHLSAGVGVSIVIKGKKLTITSTVLVHPSLSSLLAAMRRQPNSKQKEIDWGAPRGNEIW
ncbi:MAG TPA: AbrB/MazE/SpoVT family DNA-binding domain-containing protein [Candidatus Paceibacterota bacterium]